MSLCGIVSPSTEEINGRWQLILGADYDEISTVRNLGPVTVEGRQTAEGAERGE